MLLEKSDILDAFLFEQSYGGLFPSASRTARIQLPNSRRIASA
jgi:hypothetical protein